MPRAAARSSDKLKSKPVRKSSALPGRNRKAAVLAFAVTRGSEYTS
jgi:hypothetical protein